MFLFSESDGVAIVSAFFCGVAAIVIGGAGYYGILDQIKKYREINRTMATRK